MVYDGSEKSAGLVGSGMLRPPHPNSNLTSANTTARPSEVSSNSEDLERVVQQLADSLAFLEDKLGPILRPEGPEKVGDEAYPEPSTQVAQFMAAQTRNVRRMINRVQNIHSRIEL